MPLSHGVWKITHTHFWIREYSDGRVESEFNQETGAPVLWGPKTPDGLVRVGWYPIDAGLAAKIAAWGEIAQPNQGSPIIINLKPGDELICHKDRSMFKGMRYHCRACGGEFLVFGEAAVCPMCGAAPFWSCPECGKLGDHEACPDCQKIGRHVTPFTKRPAIWEELVYVLGIEDRFVIEISEKDVCVEH